MVDRVTVGLAPSLRTLWVHAELREDDSPPGSDRQSSGWLATIEDGTRGAFSPTRRLPAWARIPRAAVA
jgi:hypothetical protein